MSHILIILLPKYFYFCDQILHSKTCHFIYRSLVSKLIHFTIGINNWWIYHWSTFLWLNREEKYIRADLPFLCLSSLMWWFGQRILSKLSSIEKEGNLWPKKKENIKKKSKAPTCGQLCRSQANTPFHHRGLYSNRTWPAVGTYGTCDCFLTPITPTGDHLAASHSTNSTHPHC